MAALPPPPSPSFPAEYGTVTGIPNKLYFVPHAKVQPCCACCAVHATLCCAATARASGSPLHAGPGSSCSPSRLLYCPLCSAPCTALPLTSVPQALIFYKSVKAGMLLGVEQGAGFVIARRAAAPGSCAARLASASAASCLHGQPQPALPSSTRPLPHPPLQAGRRDEQQVERARVCQGHRHRVWPGGRHGPGAPQLLFHTHSLFPCRARAAARLRSTNRPTRPPIPSVPSSNRNARNNVQLQAETLVGVLSDRALDGLISSKGKMSMSSNW